MSMCSGGFSVPCRPSLIYPEVDLKAAYVLLFNRLFEGRRRFVNEKTRGEVSETVRSWFGRLWAFKRAW